MGTNLFGSEYPEWFGTLGASMFSLFQIMTLEGWADISRTITKTLPYANIYFITFIALASYTTLNIFIAIVVNTMGEVQKRTSDDSVTKIEELIQDEKEELRKDILLLKEQVLKLEEKLTRRTGQ